MDEIEDLREQRKAAWKRVKASHSLFKRANKLCDGLKKRWEKDEKEYEEIDYKLALLDGRHSLVVHETKGKVRRELTIEELMQVMEALGIQVVEQETGEREEEENGEDN